jgi:SAM-dependent methyltransferase
LRRLLGAARTVAIVPFVAGNTRDCRICGHGARRFLKTGNPRRAARCYWCGSVERQRLLWRYLEGQQFDSVLHVAPERCLGDRLQRDATRYQSIDLDSPRADVHADITRPLPLAERFDLVLCSHVLEHIPDDRAAIRELSKVLSPGGRLVILVPTEGDKTVEEQIDDPAERVRRYGQADHVRMYGSDVVERIASQGLDVQVVSWQDVPADAARLEGIDEAAGDVYVCTQPSATQPAR